MESLYTVGGLTGFTEVILRALPEADGDLLSVYSMFKNSEFVLKTFRGVGLISLSSKALNVKKMSNL